MAATVAAMEQYGFTPDELDAALVSANADLHSSTAKLKPIETAIREKKDLQKQVLAYRAVGEYAGRYSLFQHSLEAVLKIAEKRRQVAA